MYYKDGFASYNSIDNQNKLRRNETDQLRHPRFGSTVKQKLTSNLFYMLLTLVL